jgi:putative N6-adenine-specific DNA methylase
MKRRYTTPTFPENGPLYTIEVSVINDMVSVTIDTSGPGLHKRGYRDEAGEAPIKETLAAALVLLSGWRRHMAFIDPMCGSGTIPIEAALIGANIAPGLYRSFVAETWPSVPGALWDEERKAAKDAIRDTPVAIVGTDADDNAIHVARRNARRAGVDRAIRFEVVPVEKAVLSGERGVVVCNPPYGERIGDRETIESLYRSMGRALLQVPGWAISVLSAHPDFQRFFGKAADRNRKLYNGRIKCYLYQYNDPGHVPRQRTVT